MAGVARPGDLERPGPEGQLDYRQAGARLDRVLLERSEEVISAPVPGRVGDNSHDVQDGGQRLDDPTMVGPPPADRSWFLGKFGDAGRSQASTCGNAGPEGSEIPERNQMEGDGHPADPRRTARPFQKESSLFRTSL